MFVVASDLLKSEFPEHSILFLVKNILARRNHPMAKKFPLAGREFVEEWNRMPAPDSVVERSIWRIQFLIASTAVAGVMNNFASRTVKVRIAWIDPAEVSE